MIYINIEQAIEIHKITVKISGGGSDGILDAGRLESVLKHIQNDDYYPTFEEKLTHLFFGANKFHCFEDGNKRIAIALGAHFLLINGYVFIVKLFIQEMENISYHVAAGKIEKELLYRIIHAIINNVEFPDNLKIEIFNAINT
ncbi:MAG: type II toxin-antitoxin system death-on-curing family toxin [Bacteroidetes bacterium]|nr:MAG: type II toxin-antitoxin system death-on-curing family toxin [Bacteroidota bacterium]